METDPVVSVRDFQSIGTLASVPDPSSFARWRVSPPSFGQRLHRNGATVNCLLESHCSWQMARSEAVKRMPLCDNVTHSKSSNRAYFRDLGSRVHWSAVRLPPELDSFQANRKRSDERSGFFLWRCPLVFPPDGHLTCSNYDGAYFDSERSISIVPSIDGPYLSVRFVVLIES